MVRLAPVLVCPRCFNAFSFVDRCPLDGARLSRKDRVPAPRQVGRFEVESFLVEGRASRIFRAVERGGRKVALKIFHGELAVDRVLSGKLVNRARAMARLSRLGLVPIVEADVTPLGLPYVARALSERGSLAGLMLRAGAHPPRTVARLARDIAEALSKLHRAGFVHGDLRPGAIMLNGEAGQGGVRLLDPLDHGLVRAVLPELDQSPSSQKYVAPEQLASEATTPLSDLYVLGVILHELLVGYPPFTSRAAHKTEAVPVIALPYEGLRELSAALLEKEPTRRLASADAVLEQLACLGLLEEDEVPSNTSSAHSANGVDAWMPSARSWRSRLEHASGLGVGVVLLAASVLAVRLGTEDDAKESDRHAVASVVSSAPDAGDKESDRHAVASVVFSAPDAGDKAEGTARVMFEPSARADFGAAPSMPARSERSIAPDVRAHSNLDVSSKLEFQRETEKKPPAVAAARRPRMATASATVARPSLPSEVSSNDELFVAFGLYDRELGRVIAEAHLVWRDLAAHANGAARQWSRWKKREPIRSMDELAETFHALRSAAESLSSGVLTSTTSS